MLGDYGRFHHIKALQKRSVRLLEAEYYGVRAGGIDACQHLLQARLGARVELEQYLFKSELDIRRRKRLVVVPFYVRLQLEGIYFSAFGYLPAGGKFRYGVQLVVQAHEPIIYMVGHIVGAARRCDGRVQRARVNTGSHNKGPSPFGSARAKLPLVLEAAQQRKQDLARLTGVLRVKLKYRPLEDLHSVNFTIYQAALLELVGERVTLLGQAAVLLPVLPEFAADYFAGSCAEP